jgi:hypothetical protein
MLVRAWAKVVQQQVALRTRGSVVVRIPVQRYIRPHRIVERRKAAQAFLYNDLSSKVESSLLFRTPLSPAVGANHDPLDGVSLGSQMVAQSINGKGLAICQRWYLVDLIVSSALQ